MVPSAELVQWGVLIAVVIFAASSVAAVFILALMRRDLAHVLRPTARERFARLQMQSDANRRLLETPAGRAALVDFFVSEANISGFLREAEEQLEGVENDAQLKELLERLRREEKPWYSFDRLKKGAKALGEKLFDKANDLVKSYVGGKGGEGG